MSPWPPLSTSMKALRSRVSAIARRRSGLSKGGALRLTINVLLTPRRPQLANRLRLLALDVLQQRDGHLVGKGHVELAGDKGQQRRRAVRDDRPFDAVEIGPARLPVIRVAGQPDQLVRLVRDEFERPGADRMLAHVAAAAHGRDRPANIRRPAARSRPAAAASDGRSPRRSPLAVTRSRFQYHDLARIDAELGGRLAEQHVPGALDVLGGKRLPVVPGRPRAGGRSALCRPRSTTSSGEVRHDRLQGVLRHMLVEQHEIVEHRHHRRDRRDRHFLEGRHAGRAVAMGDPQHAARLLRECALRGHRRERQHSCRAARPARCAGRRERLRRCGGRPFRIRAR